MRSAGIILSRPTLCLFVILSERLLRAKNQRHGRSLARTTIRAWLDREVDSSSWVAHSSE